VEVRRRGGNEQTDFPRCRRLFFFLRIFYGPHLIFVRYWPEPPGFGGLEVVFGQQLFEQRAAGHLSLSLVENEYTGQQVAPPAGSVDMVSRLLAVDPTLPCQPISHKGGRLRWGGGAKIRSAKYLWIKYAREVETGLCGMGGVTLNPSLFYLARHHNHRFFGVI